jgi:hypothetical protein
MKDADVAIIQAELCTKLSAYRRLSLVDFFAFGRGFSQTHGRQNDLPETGSSK